MDEMRSKITLNGKINHRPVIGTQVATLLSAVLTLASLSCSQPTPDPEQKTEQDLQRFGDSIMHAHPPHVLRTLPDSAIEMLWAQTRFDFGDSLEVREWRRVLDSLNAKAMSRAQARREKQVRTDSADAVAATRASQAEEINRVLQSTLCKRPSRERARRGLNQGYDGRALEYIACQSVYIGMTADEARASWGEPDDINRTTYRFGVHEQWVYGKYGERGILYFEDGTLTTIQN